jgi:hypothetical protein
MKLDKPFVSLGPVDCAALTAKVLALDEAVWAAETHRQETFDPHVETQSIILMFCDGWPTVKVREGKGWALLGAEAVPVMQTLIARGYPPGGVVLRAMMARLTPGRRIKRHLDTHPSFTCAHRIHVPLQTNPDVEFVIGETGVPPVAGEAFEINNRLGHHVINNGVCDRIHFIFDYAPPEELKAPG